MGLGLFDNNAIPLIPRPLPEPPASSSASPNSDDAGDITDYHAFSIPQASYPRCQPPPFTEAELSELAFRAFQYSTTENMSTIELAIHSPLPPPTPTEVASFDVQLTPMEANEAEEGFGKDPLEVRDGIAVTEEAVGLHVADLIMQI